MSTSKRIYNKKEDMTWQLMRAFLLSVTNSNGIVDKSVVATAKEHKLWRWTHISLFIRKGDKIFNGDSQVHIDMKSKKYFDLYMNFKYPESKGFKDIGQIKLPFSNPPHIIKDAKDMTVTVVPQGKEQEFIEKKHKVERICTPTFEVEKPKEIGLIRKFWRWIY